VRRLIVEFRHRGWSDSSNAALAIVRALAVGTGTGSLSKATHAVPRSFLAENRVKRSEIERMLLDLANAGSPLQTTRVRRA
jgi:hypothetical protein